MIKGTDILEIYKQKFGMATLQVASPGRANIIGEHTDYNDGFVLPFAIDKKIYFAAGPNNGDHFQIFASNKNKEVSLYPGQIWNKGFAKYFSSVINILREKAYKTTGLNIVFGGDLPIGAGMSSSSAITCGFIGLLNQNDNLGLSKDEIVQLAVEAEHGAGLEGGNMDQYSIVNGNSNSAILLDCMQKTSQLLEVDLNDYSFCLFNTNVSHNLEETEYNTRARTCKNALLKIQEADQSVNSLRDVTKNHLHLLSSNERNRITHVIEENSRVEKTVAALSNNDAASVGMLLNQSHESLRDLYEVSCPELDYIQDFLINQKGVAGARMMGGGFGGCVIALLDKDCVKDISLQLDPAYKEKFDLQLEVYPIKPETGLEVTSVTQ